MTEESTKKWRVVAEPVGNNPGKLAKAVAEKGLPSGTKRGVNEGGMVVYVSDGASYKQEVARVAWIRRHSKNPGKSFNEQLAMVVAAAREACDLLNGTLAGSGELV
jgi:hypothetical protein